MKLTRINFPITNGDCISEYSNLTQQKNRQNRRDKVNY